MFYIVFLTLALVVAAMVFEDKFTRYRLVKVTDYHSTRYRLQKTIMYVFWTDMMYSISPYSERLCEYDDFQDAVKALNRIKEMAKGETIEVVK